MGSESDWQVMRSAAEVMKDFEIEVDTQIVSAHRTPEKLFDFAKTADQKGFQVIIAGAGGAAHLPGMIASLTSLPVIGVPISATKLDGLDALLSIVQMPKAVPVATVAIDGAANAALLALRILAISDKKLSTRMNQYREDIRKSVEAMSLPSH